MNGATQQLTQPQRNALLKMMQEWGDVWSRAKRKYEETRTSRKEAIIREVAGDGIVKAKDNLLSLKAKVQAAEDDLRQLGFELDSEGALDLVSDESRLAKSIERRLDAEVGTKDAVLTRAFDNARVKLLLAATAEEAEHIVGLVYFTVTSKLSSGSPVPYDAGPVFLGRLPYRLHSWIGQAKSLVSCFKAYALLGGFSLNAPMDLVHCLFWSVTHDPRKDRGRFCQIDRHFSCFIRIASHEVHG